MGYRVLVAAIVAVHFVFLAEVVAGGFLAFWRRWLFWVHLAAVGWAIAILTVPGLVCPLTAAENWARRRAGLSSYTGGFIDRYVQGHLYPTAGTPVVQVTIAVAVAGSWALLARRARQT
jgi:uncharacterized protein DUF2784